MGIWNWAKSLFGLFQEALDQLVQPNLKLLGDTIVDNGHFEGFVWRLMRRHLHYIFHWATFLKLIDGDSRIWNEVVHL